MVLIISVFAAYDAFYELFIDIPGVKVPRITITPGVSGIRSTDTRVEFSINTPTVGLAVVLFSAGLCIAIGIRALCILYRTRIGIKQRFFAMAILVLIQLVAYAVMFEDFFIRREFRLTKKDSYRESRRRRASDGDWRKNGPESHGLQVAVYTRRS